MKKRWLDFLCWFLDHRMKVIFEDVNWCVIDRLKKCQRCGLTVEERQLGPF
jgi:hypothetical protein